MLLSRLMKDDTTLLLDTKKDFKPSFLIATSFFRKKNHAKRNNSPPNRSFGCQKANSGQLARRKTHLPIVTDLAASIFHPWKLPRNLVTRLVP